jgi:hypothetical protein
MHWSKKLLSLRRIYKRSATLRTLQERCDDERQRDDGSPSQPPVGETHARARAPIRARLCSESLMPGVSITATFRPAQPPARTTRRVRHGAFIGARL